MVKYDFAKYFVSAYQNRLAREQEEENLAKKLGFEERQMSLLDSYRQAQAKLDQDRLKETIRHNQTIEGIRDVPKPVEKLIKSGFDKATGKQFDAYGYDENTITDIKYREPIKPSGSGSNNTPDEGKIYDAGDLGKLDKYAKALKEIQGADSGFLGMGSREVDINFGDKTTPYNYQQLKSESQAELTTKMQKLNVPMNGKVANFIRSFFNDGDTAEDKRKIMDLAIQEAKKNFNLNDQQETILRYWKEIGTR